MGISSFFKSILEGGKVDITRRYEILRDAVLGTMSDFHMARDRETDQVVGLKILDKKKHDQLEMRFAGSISQAKVRLQPRSTTRGLSRHSDTDLPPKASNSW